MNLKKETGWVCRLGLLLLAMTAGSAFAVEVKGLYEVELIAHSQSATDRELAIKQAMFAVLNRVVVAEDIAQVPAVQQLLNSAQNYVKQSQYSLISADGASDTDARLLRVEFDEDQLLEVLRSSKVGLWSEIRPETLLWLVIDEDGKRQFYNADAMPNIESALSLGSKLTGLPVIYPMLDLEEQQKISVSEVLGVDSKNLLAVSSRYEVPAIMAGRLAKKGECWQGEWAFHFDGKIKQWESPCQSLKTTIQAGLHGAYLVLSSYYGIKPELH